MWWAKPHAWMAADGQKDEAICVPNKNGMARPTGPALNRIASRPVLQTRQRVMALRSGAGSDAHPDFCPRASPASR